MPAQRKINAPCGVLHVMRLLHFLPAITLAVTLSSCSVGYAHRWNKAAASAETTNPTTLLGAWEGTWRSEASGHTGTLRAIVTAPSPEANPTHYTFHYEPVWKQMLRVSLKAEHEAKRKDARGPWILSGEKDLGVLGGVYRFTGTATTISFKANYASAVDHGVFEMKRPTKK